mmetsp:Transcript_1904/g.7970  ORF Transcript_1904/g.7970 Transcript_1904/m.7970 type:complete len:235 (-) Transcript_1904:1192-1896(-)
MPTSAYQKRSEQSPLLLGWSDMAYAHDDDDDAPRSGATSTSKAGSFSAETAGTEIACQPSCALHTSTTVNLHRKSCQLIQNVPSSTRVWSSSAPSFDVHTSLLAPHSPLHSFRPHGFLIRSNRSSPRGHGAALTSSTPSFATNDVSFVCRPTAAPCSSLTSITEYAWLPTRPTSLCEGSPWVAQPIGNFAAAYESNLDHASSDLKPDASNRIVSVGQPVRSNKPSAIHPPLMAW